MLNVFLQKHKKINKVVSSTQDINKLGYTRHFPPASKEWNNSIYAFNKNTSKLLPAYDKMAIKLIKSYFYLYTKGKKTRSRRFRVRLKRLSTNRIFVSKAEVKHSNSKIIMTLYIYNGQLRYLINRLKNIHVQETRKSRKQRKYKKINFFSMRKKVAVDNKILPKKIRLVKHKSLKILKQIEQEKKNLVPNTIKWENYSLKRYENQYFERLVKKLFKKEILTIYYKRLLYFNLSKFENNLILPLSNIISKIYRKKVEFNLVNLKYLHLNSDILSTFIATKLRKRKNRLLKVLRYCLNIVKVPISNKWREKYNTDVTNNTFNPFLLDKTERPGDILDKLLKNFFTQEKSKYSVESTVLDSIKYKSINGIRLEASGRLTKRFTAARSLFKFRYKGSLENIDSSYKGLSSTILRGNVKSNIQYSKKVSKTRNGSFGLKGWISSK